MTRRSSKRFKSYFDNKQDYRPPKRLESHNVSDEPVEVDNLIADVARGFIQAQDGLMQKKQTDDSQEVVQMLKRIEQQLQQMNQLSNQQKQANSPGQQNQPQQFQHSQQQQSQDLMSQQLQSIFKQVLQVQNAEGAQANKNSGNSGVAEQNKGSKEKINTITVQTAAQVLSQAQYELSTELEASLKKLKQVISESEKLANKISNLLGEENSPQKKQ